MVVALVADLQTLRELVWSTFVQTGGYFEAKRNNSRLRHLYGMIRVTLSQRANKSINDPSDFRREYVNKHVVLGVKNRACEIDNY